MCRAVAVLAAATAVALGCGNHGATEPLEVPVANAAAPRPAVDHSPFVIHNVVVAEDGAVVRTIAELQPSDTVVPDGPHRYRHGELVFDSATGAVTPAPAPVSFTTKDGTSTLERRGPDGRRRWAATLTGRRSGRPPDVALGDNRLVAAIDTQIHAFEDASGTPVWTANVDGDRLRIVGDTVYSTMCNAPTHDHWLIGIALADGTERFRAALAGHCDPWLMVVNDWLIAVEDHPAQTLVFDLAGHLAASFDEKAQDITRGSAAGSPRARDTTWLVTDKRVLALDRRGRVRWQREHLGNTFAAANALAALPDGDVVIANYGAISDSGADLVRIHPDGSLAWRSCANPLLVDHSAYAHVVYIEVRGEDLFVASQGSYGGFLERLSVVTGARLVRCVLDGAATRCTHEDSGCIRHIRLDSE